VLSTFGARARIDGCDFNTNTANVGGALDLQENAEVSGSSFVGNTGTQGGAIEAETDLIVDDCTFTGNETTAASQGGGAINADSATITRSTFVSNVSISGGGALRFSSTGSRVENCTFEGNEGSGGGAIDVSFGGVDVVNCAFSGNATGSGGSGGAIRFDNSATGSLVNCSFQGNHANLGGAVAVSSGTVDLANTVIWGNDATSTAVTGGDSIFEGTTSTVTYSHSLVEFLTPAGVGNLDGTNPANDPNFTSPVNPLTAPATGADLRLQAGSPVIDQGLNSANDTTLELDGLLRFAGSAIDLGAYEFGSSASVTFASLFPTLAPGDDDNGNGLSNYLDYALGTDPTGPFDPSGRVLLNGNILTLPSRAGAADVFATWEKSTTLATGSWSEMVEGVDYNVDSVNTVGSQTLTEIELIGVTPPIFFRQSFDTAP
jgi:hypothetical protein